MVEQGVDLVALGPGAHLAWLLDVRPHGDERPLLLCVTQSYAGFLMPSLEAESAAQQTDLPFHTWGDADGPDAAFAALLKKSGAMAAKSIVLDETMRARLSGACFQVIDKNDISSEFALANTVKSALIKKSA